MNRFKDKPVAICFADTDITFAFAELFRAIGVPVELMADLKHFTGNQLLVTEPQYMRYLDDQSIGKTLLVGNKETLPESGSTTLSRPLTEEKIEVALSQFLSLG
jgi:hypothetical protein